MNNIAKIRGTLDSLTVPIAVETKYDGELEYIHIEHDNVYLVNKYGRVRRDMPVTDELTDQLKDKNMILCGELFMNDGKDFYTDFINDKFNRDMNLAIFDIVSLDNQDMRYTPYYKRRKILESIQIRKHYFVTGCEIADSRDEVRAYADETIHNGYEGIVAKSIQGNLLNAYCQAKIKRVLSYDLLTGNGVLGRNSIALIDGDNKEVGNVSLIGHNDVRTGQIVEVECTGVTPTIKLRNPRIKRVRHDKNLPDRVERSSYGK